MQFECGTRILRVIHGRDARAAPSNCITLPQFHKIKRTGRDPWCIMFGPMKLKCF